MVSFVGEMKWSGVESFVRLLTFILGVRFKEDGCWVGDCGGCGGACALLGGER